MNSMAKFRGHRFPQLRICDVGYESVSPRDIDEETDAGKPQGADKQHTDHCAPPILDAPDITDVACQPKKDDKLVLGREAV